MLLFWCGALAASDWANTSTRGVQDFASNPILLPSDVGEWVLGDPTLVKINDTLFMWANEEIHGIVQFSADAANPTAFTKLGHAVEKPGANRPFAYLTEQNTVVLFYEQYQPPLFRTSKLVWIESTASPEGGAWKWTSPTVALEPELAWEKVGTQRVGNPFVYFHKNSSKWRLHYSASSIHLPDSNVDEPLHLGLAEADSLRGKWTRATDQPMVILGGEIANETFVGVGSFKLIKGGPRTPAIQGLMNRITNASGVTGSTICTVKQVDDSGTRWQVVTPSFLAPTPDSAGPNPKWKESYVYGFDTITDPTDSTRLLIYYNGRNGWKGAHEAVGVSRVDSDFLAPQ